MDFAEAYEGVEDVSSITEEMVNHWFDIKDKELTADHRDIYRLTPEQRAHDFVNPCKPKKKFMREKGEALDRLCAILEISKDRNFHEQIKPLEIYQDDLINSDWYKYVLKYTWELREIFGLEIGKDFADNPLKYCKMFCVKALGITCTLEQPQGSHPDEFKALVKEHNKHEVYRKLSGETPRPWSKKKPISDEWIDKQIEQGEELSLEEKRLRRLRKHIKISLHQPRYKRYLLDIEKSPIFNIAMKNGITHNKHLGG